MNLTDSDFIRELNEEDTHRFVAWVTNALETYPAATIGELAKGFREYIARTNASA